MWFACARAVGRRDVEKGAVLPAGKQPWRGKSMRKNSLVVLCVLLAVPLRSEAAEDQFSRVGISFGGGHIVGVYFERHFGDASARAQVGYMLRTLSINVSALRYFRSSKHQPYVGIGFMKHLRDRSFQGANLLCFPLGADFDMSNNHYIGAELIPAVCGSALNPRDSKRPGLRDYILPLPSILYKYRL